MAPKYHPTPVSGSHRKALAKALTRSRAMTSILARRAAETRAAGEAMIREADDLLCQSWNERMWADGEPVDPSPTVDQAINGGYPWLEIACSRCRTPRTVDLASLPHVPTTCVHDLAGRLRCEKCRKAGKRPPRYLAQRRDLADLPRGRPYRHHRTTRRRPHRCRAMGLALRLPFRIATWRPCRGHGCGLRSGEISI